jgi:hypothetical protein
MLAKACSRQRQRRRMAVEEDSSKYGKGIIVAVV